MIYIRPGNLFKDFIVETNVQEIDSKGRVVIKHTGDGTNFLSGCLADATDQDRANHNIPDPNSSGCYLSIDVFYNIIYF